MIDSKPLSNGGIRIELGGKHEDIPAHIASAFMSRMLAQMQQQAAKSGDDKHEGGAILYPNAVAVEIDRETGEPRLRLAFGKALFILALPKGGMAENSRCHYPPRGGETRIT
ncbi:hypothetical protein LB533_20300 [Mesorhizobium sp. BR1-1-13]|uniref:hypothetical protein n=1 Tax=Mesorhizobium sp. BR1-1-13 TaxID=2876656 RepID=UPI001CD07E61|nr:hypothetical protein [Mesorhizobium sp. BR1-1-13]MBZ9943431.1 hypothetical protein [Mesorhizobium sp. BR1-1-13]